MVVRAASASATSPPQAGQVLADLVLGDGGVAVDHGVEHQPVGPRDIPRGLEAAEGDPQEEVAAVPERFADAGAQRRAGQLVQPFVAAAVALAQLGGAGVRIVGQIGPGGEVAEQLAECGGLCRRAPSGRQPADHRFGGGEQLVEVGHLAGYRRHHLHAHLGQHLQQPVHGEAADGVAHRCPADGQRPADAFRGDAITWVEPAVEQEALQVRIGQIVQPGVGAAQRGRRLGQIDLEHGGHELLH